MIRALVNEERRKELRDAVKAGRPIEFRSSKLKTDLLPPEMIPDAEAAKGSGKGDGPRWMRGLAFGPGGFSLSDNPNAMMSREEYEEFMKDAMKSLIPFQGEWGRGLVEKLQHLKSAAAA